MCRLVVPVPRARCSASAVLSIAGTHCACVTCQRSTASSMPDAVAAVTKGTQAGTQSGGIGLALARQLVAAHGGTMEVMSEKGQGTLVRVRLPRSA